MIFVQLLPGPHNRLGFAVQLCTVRFLGTFLADPQGVPGEVVAYVARQLDIDDPACFADYRHPQVHQRHAREIRDTHGYRQFNDQPHHFLLTRWLFTRAWLSGDQPIALFDAATAGILVGLVLVALGWWLRRCCRPALRAPGIR